MLRKPGILSLAGSDIPALSESLIAAVNTCSCSCIIEFIKLVAKRDKMLRKPRILSLAGSDIPAVSESLIAAVNAALCSCIIEFIKLVAKKR